MGMKSPAKKKEIVKRSRPTDAELGKIDSNNGAHRREGHTLSFHFLPAETPPNYASGRCAEYPPPAAQYPLGYLPAGRFRCPHLREYRTVQYPELRIQCFYALRSDH